MCEQSPMWLPEWRSLLQNNHTKSTSSERQHGEFPFALNLSSAPQKMALLPRIVWGYARPIAKEGVN